MSKRQPSDLSHKGTQSYAFPSRGCHKPFTPGGTTTMSIFGVREAPRGILEDEMVNLGDEVKDRVTGFKGIAVCRLTYLQGCDRIAVQPPVGKNGILPDVGHFDEPQLDVIKPAKAKKEESKTDNGGPDKYLDNGKIISTK